MNIRQIHIELLALLVVLTVFLAVGASALEGGEDASWNKSYSGVANAVAIDSSGSVYVVGQTPGQNWQIKKFDSNGNEIATGWNKTYNGNGTYTPDQAYDAAVDSSNNLYVVGSGVHVARSGSGYDIWIKKFAANGDEDTANWNKIIASSAGGCDEAHSIVIDHSGNIYVVGTYVTANNDWFIKKFSSDGTEETTGWNKTINFANSDIAFSAAIDNDNNLYVAGVGSSGYDWRIKKFDSNGTEETAGWNKAFGMGGNANAYSITVDKDNYVYVAGNIGPSLSTSTSWGIKKYNSAGTEIAAGWNKQINNGGRAYSVVTDEMGNVFVGGTSSSGSHVKKFNSNGAEDTANWNKTYTGTDWVGVKDIVINAGNVYAVGYNFGIKKFYGVSNDTDGDGIVDSSDNCVNVSNPMQGDYDGDSLGDLCDPCPILNGTSCSQSGNNAAVEINGTIGGNVSAEGGNIFLSIPAGSFAGMKTFVIQDHGLNAFYGGFAATESGWGVTTGHTFEPHGVTFNPPVELCFTTSTYGISDDCAGYFNDTHYVVSKDVNPGQCGPYNASEATCLLNENCTWNPIDSTCNDWIYETTFNSTCTDLAFKLIKVCANVTSFSSWSLFFAGAGIKSLGASSVSEGSSFEIDNKSVLNVSDNILKAEEGYKISDDKCFSSSEFGDYINASATEVACVKEQETGDLVQLNNIKIDSDSGEVKFEASVTEVPLENNTTETNSTTNESAPATTSSGNNGGGGGGGGSGTSQTNAMNTSSSNNSVNNSMAVNLTNKEDLQIENISSEQTNLSNIQNLTVKSEAVENTPNNSKMSVLIVSLIVISCLVGFLIVFKRR